MRSRGEEEASDCAHTSAQGLHMETESGSGDTGKHISIREPAPTEAKAEGRGREGRGHIGGRCVLVAMYISVAAGKPMVHGEFGKKCRSVRSTMFSCRQADREFDALVVYGAWACSESGSSASVARWAGGEKHLRRDVIEGPGQRCIGVKSRWYSKAGQNGGKYKCRQGLAGKSRDPADSSESG
jgi:hypothetical protein